MAKNFVVEGKVMDYLNGDSVSLASGAVVAMPSMIGIASTDIHAGKMGAVDIEGVFTLPKSTGELTIGSEAWWDKDNKVIVSATGANMVYAGKVFATAAANDGKVKVKINV